MEHSDSDSFPENIRQGFANRVPADPSRSNSLMSETSSQPDIHPFFKVGVIECEKKNLIHNVSKFLTLGSIWPIRSPLLVQCSRRKRFER